MKTVAELIEELKLLPQDALVYGRGYDGGIEDIKVVIAVNVMRDAERSWRGTHEYIDEASSTTQVGVLLR